MKKKIFNITLSFLAILVMLASTSITYALDNKKLEPNKRYNVNLSLKDKSEYLSNFYCFQQGIITTDANNETTLWVYFKPAGNDGKIIDWKIKEDEKFKSLSIVDTAEKMGSKYYKTQARAKVAFKVKANEDVTYEGQFKLDIDSENTYDFTLKILWSLIELDTEGTVDIGAPDTKPEEPGNNDFKEELPDSNTDKPLYKPSYNKSIFKYSNNHNFSNPTKLEFEYDKSNSNLSVAYTVCYTEEKDCQSPINGKDIKTDKDEFIIDKPVIIKAILKDSSKPKGQEYGPIMTVYYRYQDKYITDLSLGSNEEVLKQKDNLFYGGYFEQKDEYDTIHLFTRSKQLSLGTKTIQTSKGERKLLGTTDFYIDLKQGNETERCVLNGGIGGFIVPYDETNHSGQLIINFKKGQFKTDKLLNLHIFELGCYDTNIDLDLNDKTNIIKNQERKASEQMSETPTINIKDMKPGKVYTGSFKAVRFDNEARESMLAGFFDKNVKIEIDQNNKVKASFYNTVFAHSMLDLAACDTKSGKWYGTKADGKKTEEYNKSGMVIAATYELPIPNPNLGDMVGAVIVQAMGGTDQMYGKYDFYTKVKIKFDSTVTEGFSDFASKKMRLSQDKIRNRALMTIPDMDTNNDGYISNQEMAAAKLPYTLDFSRDAMFKTYNIHDNFDLIDIDWLKKFDNVDKVAEINFNDMRINKIKDEFKKFKNLKDLNLSANMIESIDDGAFNQLNNLKVLRLSTNMLSKISAKTFEGLNNLSGIDDNGSFELGNNRIKEIEPGSFKMMKKITSFDFSDNVLENVNIKELFDGISDNVKSVNLDQNKLSRIPSNLSILKQMTFLSMQGNKIYTLTNELNNLPEIKTIYLNRNYLAYLPEEIITSNPKLQSLYVYKNSISDLPKALLEKLDKKEGNFDSIFEYNAIKLSDKDLVGLKPDTVKVIKEKYNKYPLKSAFNVKVVAKKGLIEFKSDISALDYYIWSKTKGNMPSKTILDIVKDVLKEDRSIDSIEDLRKFRNINLPSLSSKDIEKSILTDNSNETKTTDSLTIKTSIQRLSGDEWVTIKEYHDKQDESTKIGTTSGKFFDEYAKDKGKYRLLFAVSSTIQEGYNQEYVYYFTNDGVVLENKVKGQDLKTQLENGKLLDGKYTVNIRMKKTVGNQYSMSDNAANHLVLIHVRNGIPYINTSFNGMIVKGENGGEDLKGYLGKLSYYGDGYDYKPGTKQPLGQILPAKVISVHKNSQGQVFRDRYNSNGDPYPFELEFPIVNLKRAYKDKIIPLHVFVPIMEAIYRGTGQQDVLMAFDWSSIKKVDDHTKLSDLNQLNTNKPIKLSQFKPFDLLDTLSQDNTSEENEVSEQVVNPVTNNLTEEVKKSKNKKDYKNLLLSPLAIIGISSTIVVGIGAIWLSIYLKKK